MADIEGECVNKQEVEVWVLEHARWVVDYLSDRTWKAQVKSGWLLIVSLAVLSFAVLRIPDAKEKELLALSCIASLLAILLFIVSLVIGKRLSSPASGFVEWHNDERDSVDSLVSTLIYPQKDQQRSVIIAVDDDLEIRSNYFKWGVLVLLLSLVLVAIQVSVEVF